MKRVVTSEKKIIILTGSELRHEFFRKYLASKKNITVMSSYCESTEKGLTNKVKKTSEPNSLKMNHILDREKSEIDYFSLFLDYISDNSKPIFIKSGHINNEAIVKKIINLNPDLVVAYGCSIIRGELLKHFEGRFLNVHLGLSPYYRGSGTNYWPLVNCEPEYLGATYMHIDAGIDTGLIIHQIRPKVYPLDTPSQIGNRFIIKMTKVYARLILNYENLDSTEQISIKTGKEKIYKNKDYSSESVRILYNNIKNGMLIKYVQEQDKRCNDVPIIKNKILS